jgi:hypothetical protein
MAFAHAGAMNSARTRQLAIGAAAAAVLAGGGNAAALASGGTPAHAASQAGDLTNMLNAAGQPGRAGRCAHLAARLRADGRPQAARRIAAVCARLRIARLLLHTIHGEFTVQTKLGAQTVAVEQGVVQSVGGGVITVEASDGTTWTWDLVANTVVRQHGSKVGDGALADGQRVFAAGPAVGGANDARLIIIRAASAAGPAA